MMKGQQIFLHSVRQVTGNLEGALKVSALPYALQALISLLLVGGAGTMAAGMGPGNPRAELMADSSLGMLLALVVSVVAGLWIAVAWHRYVLLNEQPQSYVPAWNGERMLSYFLRSLGYGALLIIGGAVLGAIIGIVLQGVAGFSVVLFLILIAALVQIPVAIVGFRLTAALPGAALGDEQEFLAGWKATAGHTADIAVLSVLAIGAHLAIALIGWLIFSHFWILMIVWQLLTGWVVMMVGVSVLTTLYGHYLQGRPLV
jgi:hypothetical protein